MVTVDGKVFNIYTQSDELVAYLQDAHALMNLFKENDLLMTDPNGILYKKFGHYVLVTDGDQLATLRKVD